MRTQLQQNTTRSVRWRWPLATLAAIGCASLAAAVPVAGQASAIVRGVVPDDSGITRAVERELIFDDAVPFNGVSVSTLDGVVTLDGTVDNLLAKDRAIGLTQAVKGVRSVVDELEVAPAVRPDGDIADDVKDALYVNRAAEGLEIDTTVGAGIVTLAGTVDSWTERQVAERVAKGVRGVLEVDNDLVVSPVSERADAEIAADVRAALRWDRLIDDALIDVRVSDGNVVLDGTVGSAAERTRAFSAAWVIGTRSVDSDGLEVAYWTRNDDLRADKYVEKTDAEIAAAVDDALFVDPRVLSTDVMPEVDNGRVILRGQVPNLAARRAAVAAARNTVGVWRVMDHLRIQPDSSVDDGTLAQNVQGALARDPYVERYAVSVGVRDGIVTLTGTVDSAFEKAQAEQVTSELEGVVNVRNYLNVGNALSTLRYAPYLGYPDPGDYPWYEPGGWSPRSDREIEEDIRNELWWSPFIDADDVMVDVNNGIATLTGTVETPYQLRVASENAAEGGAVSVLNRLEVERGPAGEGP